MSTIELAGLAGGHAAFTRPRICIIAMSVIADDPRVRRQGDAFARAGWEVVAVGLPGAQSTPPDWTILTCPEDNVANEAATHSTEQALEGELTERTEINEVERSVSASPAIIERPNEVIATVAPIEALSPAGQPSQIERIVESVSPINKGANCSPSSGIRRKRLALLDDWLPWRAPLRYKSVALIYSVYYNILTLLVKLVRSFYAFRSNLPNARRNFVDRCYDIYYNLLNVRARLIRKWHLRFFGTLAIRVKAMECLRAMCYRMRTKRVQFLSKFIPGGSFRYAARLVSVRFRPDTVYELYWTALQSTIIDLYDVARKVDADVWLANDWIVLPIAARLANEKGGRCVYDTHEFAAEEYAENWHWRIWKKPLVCAVERQFIRDAAVVSSVSAGIAESLDTMYRLPRPSMVIRNTPFYQRCHFRPTGERIRVLYHGIVVAGRGLEQTIDSVAAWHPEFELTIRGPGSPGYIEALRQRIRHIRLDDRVRLVPPVPMTSLVAEATEFDIGFFALPGHSRHNEFALPNKVFEYLMAGLALCVSDLPEMGRLVDEHQVGVLIPSLDPAAIAAAINGLNRGQIDTYKRNALTAAEELCWEQESARMVHAYRRLLPDAALA